MKELNDDDKMTRDQMYFYFLNCDYATLRSWYTTHPQEVQDFYMIEYTEIALEDYAQWVYNKIIDQESIENVPATFDEFNELVRRTQAEVDNVLSRED